VSSGAAPVAELRVDGGARHDLLMQFQADLLAFRVVPGQTENHCWRRLPGICPAACAAERRRSGERTLCRH
jgi:glycerol kinase